MQDPFRHPDSPVRIFDNGFGIGGFEIRTRTCTCANRWEVSYCEYGDPDGTPVLYFHGWPGSRYEAGLVASGLEGLGVRLIAFDRPGFGLSSPHRGRSLGVTCDLILSFIKKLGLKQFHLLAVSGGCPFALGVAGRIPDQIRSIAVVGGLGPTARPELVRHMMGSNQVLLGMARWTPWLSHAVLSAGRLSIPFARPDHFPKLIKPIFPDADFQVLSRPEIYLGLNLVMREAFRQSMLGAYDDGRIFGLGWDLPEFTREIPVHFWHGRPDAVVPCEMSRWMAANIPSAQLIETPDDGHFSLPVEKAPEILRLLLSV